MDTITAFFMVALILLIILGFVAVDQYKRKWKWAAGAYPSLGGRDELSSEFESYLSWKIAKLLENSQGSAETDMIVANVFREELKRTKRHPRAADWLLELMQTNFGTEKMNPIWLDFWGQRFMIEPGFRHEPTDEPGYGGWRKVKIEE